MKFIQKMYFKNEADKALELYKLAFGCTVKCWITYADAVKAGWEKPNPAKDSSLYHCEIMFGEQEIRMENTEDESLLENVHKVEYLVGFDTEEEVVKAFNILSEGGEVIRPLEKPPFMVVIGSVRDRFGNIWVLMCDFA